MDQIVSFFAGDAACDAGLAYYYLEANQIFDEDDPMNHDAIFYPTKEEIIPRALFFGDKLVNQIYISLEIQTYINDTKVFEKDENEEE